MKGSASLRGLAPVAAVLVMVLLALAAPVRCGIKVTVPLVETEIDGQLDRVYSYYRPIATSPVDGDSQTEFDDRDGNVVFSGNRDHSLRVRLGLACPLACPLACWDGDKVFFIACLCC